MRIEIKIPIGNPWQIIAIVAIGLWVFVPLSGKQTPAQANGQGGTVDAKVVMESQESAQRERIKQAVLAKREEILRYQLLLLTEEADRSKTPEAQIAVAQHRAKLVELIKEKNASENLLKQSLIALWEAQGTSFAGTAPAHSLTLTWPVEPTYGLSAKFKDDAYQQRFGLPHHAIDIPIEQGTIIRAPANGLVIAAKDNGLGYSYLTLDHGNGIETIYGHVSGFLVAQGDRIREGDPVAISGGRPGSPGAGLLTTGPHLHFAVKQDGVLVDPLEYLMPWKGLKDFEPTH